MLKIFLLVSVFRLETPVIQDDQIITGTVSDKETGNAIYSASVYFSGTSMGTLTDQNGNFTIDISKYHGMPLTISAMGYYSETIRITEGKPVQIKLLAKPFVLNEVKVNATGRRKENLTVFRKIFLGTTSNAIACKIENEDEIRFKYSGDTLRAFALGPLIIDNKALGYRLTYYLDTFQYDLKTKTFLFGGNIYYGEDTVNVIRNYAHERRRQKAYLGSRMHFFRSLWTDNLKANGFIITDSAKKRINYSDLVSESEDHKKYLYYPEKLYIYYSHSSWISIMSFCGVVVYFDASGFFDASKVVWEGDMALRRVADQLPFEYYPLK
jgi:hypothetical protein